MRSAAQEAGVLLDACALLNLFATGCFDEIVDGAGLRFAVIEYVLREETLYVLLPDRSPPGRENVDVAGAVARGALSVVEVKSDDEAETFVSLATELDDGEARTLAVAAHRGLAVATDDRKARRIAEAQFPGMQLYRTLDLVRRWADANTVDDARLTQVLRNIRQRSNFAPGRHDPHLFWWRAHLDTGQEHE